MEIKLYSVDGTEVYGSVVSVEKKNFVKNYYMTKEEVIEVLDRLKSSHGASEEETTALDIAIGALKQQPIWRAFNEKPEAQKEYKYRLDAICVFWYDGWNFEQTTINEDGKFIDSKGKEMTIYDYWCYADDLMPTYIYDDMMCAPEGINEDRWRIQT